MITSGILLKVEEGKEFMVQEEYYNGFKTRENHLRSLDALRMLLSLFEDVELANYLVTEIESFEEVLRESLHCLNEDKVITDIFTFIMDRINNDEHDGLVSELFYALQKQVDARTFQIDQLTRILDGAFLDVKKMNYHESSKYNRLFRLLVEKLDLNVKNATILISFFIKKIYESQLLNEKNQEEMKLIFETLVEKCSGQWVSEVIAKRRPQTTIVETPLLPPGTIYYKETLSGHNAVLIEVPKQKRDILYQGTTYKQVGHPKMLFSFAVKDNKIADMRIFTVKNQPIMENTRIYQYPFPHVYDNFTVCWNHKGMEIKGLGDLPRVINLFFRSPNSNHLMRGNAKEVFKKLQGNDFDDPTLIETEYTLGRLLGI